MAKPGLGRSIRLRLAVSGLAMIVVTMGAAGWILTVLFENHVQRRVVDELETDLRQLMAGLKVTPEGTVSFVRRPTDQRYQQPFSGLYWQVASNDAVIERSRSLWDEQLALPADDLTNGSHRHILAGPQGQSVIAVERQVVVARDSGDLHLRVVAAEDRASILNSVGAFRDELAVMLVVLGGLLSAGFAIALGVGLAPFARLRSDLARLRSGRENRLSGCYPGEVAGIVENLNRLLDDRDRIAAQAKKRAADLAHGLKTPITAISVVAHELRQRGDLDIAGELADYTAAMERHVERELALARSMHSSGDRDPVPLRPLVDKLVASLMRLPKGEMLKWSIEIGPDISLRIDAASAADLLGNLLDNARKWATSRVWIRGRADDGRLLLEVEDDGPGVPDDELDRIASRGNRLDQSVPGSGLGLSIVTDIVGQLGGRLSFRKGASGGLVVMVEFAAN